MIEFINVSKTFESKTGTVHAVKDVNLKINHGEIFGVIGYSGAGKSTLVRCINLLERPTQGQVIIDKTDIMSLNAKELRNRRRKIGMIFQQFNLMDSRTVFDNVAFALRGQRKTKEEIKIRVTELLNLVGIESKRDAYPSQLSGGQKQRVAIARALANEPDILLCDEATSALDPQTTQNILKLLKTLNQTLNLTIVIITHEMAVVKEVCDRIAVMESGLVIESGNVAEVFSNPKKSLTQSFINSTSNFSHLEQLISDQSSLVSLNPNQQMIKIDFYGPHTTEAVISHISNEFNTQASIIFANVEVIQGIILGSMVVILSGNQQNQEMALDYLKSIDVKTEVILNGKHA